MLISSWQRNVWHWNIWYDLVDYQLSGERSFAELGSSLQAWALSSHRWVFLTLLFMSAFIPSLPFFYSFLNKWPSWPTFSVSPPLPFLSFLFLHKCRAFAITDHRPPFSSLSGFFAAKFSFPYHVLSNLFVGNIIFIGPESDHWQCLSVTHWLTHSITFSKLDWCDLGV